jgi:hypothetical protein
LASASTSIEEATVAESEGAAWVVAGTIFETPTHEHRPGARIPFIVDVANAVKIPIIAIGGVEPQHVEVLKAAGALWHCPRFAALDGTRNRNGTTPIHLREKRGLVGSHGAPAEEMITRYISAYDWSSGKSGEHDHSDSERRAPGDSAE